MLTCYDHVQQSSLKYMNIQERRWIQFWAISFPFRRESTSCCGSRYSNLWRIFKVIQRPQGGGWGPRQDVWEIVDTGDRNRLQSRMGQFLQRTGNSCHIFSKIGLTDGRHDEEDATGDSRDDSGIHSKSEKVCGTAFSVRKIAEKCVNPGVIFGPFGVILGHFWAILDHFGSF